MASHHMPARAVLLLPGGPMHTRLPHGNRNGREKTERSPGSGTRALSVCVRALALRARGRGMEGGSRVEEKAGARTESSDSIRPQTFSAGGGDGGGGREGKERAGNVRSRRNCKSVLRWYIESRLNGGWIGYAANQPASPLPLA